MKNIIFLLGVCLSLSFPLLAQSELQAKFSTQQVRERILNKYPTLRDTVYELDNYAVKYFPHKKHQVKKIQLPLVFHILYRKDQEIPSRKQVQKQVDALNEAFDAAAIKKFEYKHRADTMEGFLQRLAKMEIEFCEPKEGPDKRKKIDPVNFVMVDTAAWSTLDNMKFNKTGGIDAWDPESYINVWVVNLKGSNKGYAQMPKAGPVATDGIVIDFDFFAPLDSAGTYFGEGKSLVHLMGSYLGLYELWNDYEYCKDDFVTDTPIHNATNFGCFEYKHYSTCDGREIEMIMNYMDNTPDACMRMFTEGQKFRLHAMLAPGGPRNGLLDTKTKCSGDFTVVENNVLRIQEEQAPTGTDRFTIFPNPSTNNVTLSWLIQGKEPLEIRIMDISGRQIKRIRNQAAGWGQIEIATNEWKPGVYLVSLVQQDRLVSTQRLIVTK